MSQTTYKSTTHSNENVEDMKSKLLALTLKAFSKLPLRLTQMLGARLGDWLWSSNHKLRRVTDTNLAICYPDTDVEWRDELSRNSLREAGKTFTELSAFWHWEHSRLTNMVVDVNGQEAMDTAWQQQRGVIFASPHIGAWELTGLYLCQQFPMTILFKPSKNPVLDQLSHSARSRFGAKIFPTDTSGVKALFTALNKQQAIGILPDQEPKDGSGVFAPFFGRPAETMILLSRLARRNRVPVIFVVMQRLPQAQGYRFHYLPAGDAIYDKDNTIAAAELNRCVEACIKIAPEQYMWNYKRFRQQPEGYDNPYRPKV